MFVLDRMHDAIISKIPACSVQQTLLDRNSGADEVYLVKKQPQGRTLTWFFLLFHAVVQFCP